MFHTSINDFFLTSHSQNPVVFFKIDPEVGWFFSKGCREHDRKTTKQDWICQRFFLRLTLLKRQMIQSPAPWSVMGLVKWCRKMRVNIQSFHLIFKNVFTSCSSVVISSIVCYGKCPFIVDFPEGSSLVMTRNLSCHGFELPKLKRFTGLQTSQASLEDAQGFFSKMTNEPVEIKHAWVTHIKLPSGKWLHNVT